MDGEENPLKENVMDEVSRIGRTEFIAGPSQTTILPGQKRGGGREITSPNQRKTSRICRSRRWKIAQGRAILIYECRN